MQSEAWLRGPVDGVIAELVPAAHILIQAGEELSQAVADLSPEELWATPGGAASVGFHLRHIAGSLDRLLAYARGSALNESQRAALAAEKQPDLGLSRASLLEMVQQAIEQAVQVLRATPSDSLFLERRVGRAQLPSDVIGLIYHAAAHAWRHTGQVIATSRCARASGPR
ncbi:MAG: DinB family protein [Longimicrobiales bacterium]